MNAITELTQSPVTKDLGPIERAKVNRDQFMKILIAEISNQDPLDPVNQKDFLGQLATLQNLESSAALTEGIYNSSLFQEIGSASAIIGKAVRGVDDAGAAVSGIVGKVTVEGRTVRLMVNGHAVALANLTEIEPAPRFGF